MKTIHHLAISLSLVTLLSLSGGHTTAALELPAPPSSAPGDSALTLVFGAPEEFALPPSEIPLAEQGKLAAAAPARSAALPAPADFAPVLDGGSVTDGTQPDILVKASAPIPMSGTETVASNTVPEPSTFLLMALGLLGLARFMRKR